MLDLTGEIIDFTLTNTDLNNQYEKKHVCVSPTGPDQTTTRTERLLTWIIVTRPDQCPEGQKIFVRLPNVPNVGHNLPVGARLNPFGNLGSLGGWTLGSTNVEGGLHSPFPVKTKLDKVTKIINCYLHPHRNLVWLEALHQLMDKDAVEPVQNLWASSTFLGSKTTQPLETYSRSEQTKPFGDH